ncbi:MAG: hypothetical protein JSV39_00510 [Candidatus Aenigmatarchaeota archaeon]|nr:MAG: hypothetical protein JSV39_00510 [Candidatus Aenigmarchaeota archaeon]
MNRTTILTSAGMLAAIASVFQIVHIGYLSPWGMWIDFVAIPWIIAYFLFGGRGALRVSILSAIIITLVAPSTWLGAIMKWVATLPMWLIPFAWQKLAKLKLRDFRKFKIIITCLILAIILRALLVIPLNYFYAIPIWTGMSPLQAIEFIPWWIIFGLNAIQGILEFVIAWILVFRFRLERFAIWE